jgi:Winged helix DNA-binding domain
VNAGPPVLDRRALNRALLARQGLLGRFDLPPATMLAQLAGMQAQEPQAPYAGLWSRLEPFDPAALADLLAERRTVRGGLMRATIHLVAAEDYPALWALTAPVLARTFRGSAFSRALAGVDLDALLAAGRAHLAEAPRTRAELARLLASRWPGVDAPSLAMAVTLLTPVVQVPPRGLWGAGGAARWALAEQWLGVALDGPADPEPVIRRYLGAFGPASVRDVQAWCGATRLGAAVERLRGELRVVRDAAGTELVDLPDAPLPGPDVPAPVRFLPPFDNVLLAHADRTRVIAGEHRERLSRDRLMRAFLVDGFVAGTWRLEGTTLRVEPFAPLSAAHRREVAEEAERLLAFLAPGPDADVAMEAP